MFKFLPRRDLLCSVQPVSHRFHALAEHKVDNLHIIRHSHDFLDGLKSDLPEANKQYTELIASDSSLAKHFRLDGMLNFYMEHAENSPDNIKVFQGVYKSMKFINNILMILRNAFLRSKFKKSVDFLTGRNIYVIQKNFAR